MWIEIFVVDGKVKHVGYYTGTPIGVLFHIHIYIFVCEQLI
jgi:hypothetical protein